MFSPRLYYNMGFNKETRNKKQEKEKRGESPSSHCRAKQIDVDPKKPVIVK
jgi:hypothetical protein